MPHTDRSAVRFVRALLPRGEAIGEGGTLVVAGRTERLTRAAAMTLLEAGVLTGDLCLCRAGPDARGWLKRQREGSTGIPAGEANTPRQPLRLINLDESPLARLAIPARGEAEPFLRPHQVEAGERLRRLAEKAQLQPRITLSYDPARLPGAQAAGVGDLSATGADARRSLARILGALPRDCAGVVLDVCAFGKGLQFIETERGWPRRSAKLVLRIGLEQAARHWGLCAEATGPEAIGAVGWMAEGARPRAFG